MAGRRTLILGIGNILLSDEGVGIHVIRELKKKILPPEVELVDGGTGGYELIRFFKGVDKIVIIDAIKAESEAGTLVRILPEDINTGRAVRYSAHQDGFLELMQKVKELTHVPEMVIYGMVVEKADGFDLQLSDKVKENIPKLISAILKEIRI
ncbi:MAG: hydrogenase maturation protease [Calditrichaeota bacterium]|nr:hydrogenase maturation protease [Calditrichota bacterium]RQW01128.1 MAG: hydrogenase maturation protease [Calditrichota bacterium]